MLMWEHERVQHTEFLPSSTHIFTKGKSLKSQVPQRSAEQADKTKGSENRLATHGRVKIPGGSVTHFRRGTEMHTLKPHCQWPSHILYSGQV